MDLAVERRAWRTGVVVASLADRQPRAVYCRLSPDSSIQLYHRCNATSRYREQVLGWEQRVYKSVLYGIHRERPQKAKVARNFGRRPAGRRRCLHVHGPFRVQSILDPLYPAVPAGARHRFQPIFPPFCERPAFYVAAVGALDFMDGSNMSDATAAGTDASIVGRVRKRAPEACTFCRRRKARFYIMVAKRRSLTEADQV